MEFAIPGFIEQFCTPNALLTFMEYLTDYASPDTRRTGLERIQKELGKIQPGPLKDKINDRLRQIQETETRDLYF